MKALTILQSLNPNALVISVLDYSNTTLLVQSTRRDFKRSITKRFSHRHMQVNSFDANHASNSTRSPKIESEYAQVIHDLNSLQSKSRELALAKYRDPTTILPALSKQLKLVGIKQSDIENLNVIHVSGTKGKGSVCAFTESILRAHKLKTGFYNSPHLISVTERIKINGEPIDGSKFVKYFRYIFDTLKNATERDGVEMPNYFSFLTILAFHSFIEESVDCAIVEVGIGGEYDPTNVIERPVACGITTLDFDHTNILGSTLESIAWNKAGIIKHRVPVFTIEHEQQKAFKVIKDRARAADAPLFVCKRVDPKLCLDLGIKSSVQYVNASLACQLAKYMLAKLESSETRASPENLSCQLEINPKDLTPAYMSGLKTCSWLGRCQVIKRLDKTYFLDGAHTGKSMQNCVEWFTQTSTNNDEVAEQILMVNVIGERDKVEVLRPLAAYKGFKYVLFSTNKVVSEQDNSSSQTFTAIGVDKSLDNAKKNASVWISLMKEESQDHSNILIKSNIDECLDFINELSPDKTDKPYHILVTGSLHFVGAFLGRLAQ